MLLAGACGDSGDGDTDALVSSCKDFCAGLFGLGCDSPNMITESQCNSGCDYLPTQLDGQCVSEYQATFDCANAGGYQCVDGVGPAPKAACVEESTALNQCISSLDCKKYCQAASDAGCGGASVDACVDACTADRTAFGTCSFELDSLHQCQTQLGVTCDGDEPSTSGCEDEAAQISDCLATFEDPCLGYCYASVSNGCSTESRDACTAACGSTRDSNPSCSSSYEYWLECVARSTAPTCDAGELDASECASDKQSYDSCVAGM
ncbi:MAG TPA: hypothetical protein VL400_27030 [Polyangiaceae bacterium]|jgi:hypothetical protein|nr:hypothetical protein [Polyangiaceae bacterium]